MENSLIYNDFLSEKEKELIQRNIDKIFPKMIINGRTYIDISAIYSMNVDDPKDSSKEYSSGLHFSRNEYHHKNEQDSDPGGWDSGFGPKDY